MKILFITDLDGTLLNSKTALSEYTTETLNTLINNGMIFSYATARSLSSAGVVTSGLNINKPVITYNGTFIVNPDTKEKYRSLYFNWNETETVKNTLKMNSVYPIVYANINGEEKVSWIESLENDGIKDYKTARKGDNRLRPVEKTEQLYEGEIFYFSCIADKNENLFNAYEYLKDKPEFYCTLQKELYRDEYWFEIMVKKATKGNAVLELKKMLNCEKVISFGDAINDIPMFKISDECYAVENAADELKKISSGTIGSNDNDGVAKWLQKYYL